NPRNAQFNLTQFALEFRSALRRVRWTARRRINERWTPCPAGKGSPQRSQSEGYCPLRGPEGRERTSVDSVMVFLTDGPHAQRRFVHPRNAKTTPDQVRGRILRTTLRRRGASLPARRGDGGLACDLFTMSNSRFQYRNKKRTNQLPSGVVRNRGLGRRF